jgi:hypothetical protein
MAETLRPRILHHLATLRPLPVADLLEQRYRKYRSIGDFRWADPGTAERRDAAEESPGPGAADDAPT